MLYVISIIVILVVVIVLVKYFAKTGESTGDVAVQAEQLKKTIEIKGVEVGEPDKSESELDLEKVDDAIEGINEDKKGS